MFSIDNKHALWYSISVVCLIKRNTYFMLLKKITFLGEKMKKKIVLTILYCLLVGIVVLFAVEIASGKEITTTLIFRSVLLFVATIISIVRVTNRLGGKPRKSILQKEFAELYQKEIQNGFSADNQKKALEGLYDAIYLYNTDQNKKAIKKLNSLLAMCKTRYDYAAVLTFLALCHVDIGLNHTAITLYQKVLQYDDTRSTIWSNLGLLYKDAGDCEKAIDCYETAIKHDEKNAYPYTNLAGIHYVMGNYEKAIENGKKALELKSDMRQASTLVCLSYCALNCPEEAKKYFNISITLGEDKAWLKEEFAEILSNIDVHSRQNTLYL